jgi:hypothetical protein
MYVFAEPVTEEQADKIQSAGEEAQKKFAENVVGIKKDDDKLKAAWQDVQNDVDEQVQEDENLTSVSEAEEETQIVGEDATEASEENVAATEASAEDVAATEDTPKGPLMGWTLTVRSRVNGEYVERPMLEDEDEWEIEYHLKEIPESQRWKLYGALKERRRQLVGQKEEEADKGLKHYLDLIKRYSKRGRKWREEQDAIDRARGIQMYRPLGPGSDAVEYGETMSNQESPAEAAEEAEAGIEDAEDTENAEVEESGSEDAKEAESDIEETKHGESLSQEKKEEVLDGVPASPS